MMETWERRKTIGPGKAEAIAKFLQLNGADAAACWAIGDDLSDLPMLELVGNPVAVGCGTPLANLANKRGWTILQGPPSSADLQSKLARQNSLFT